MDRGRPGGEAVTKSCGPVTDRCRLPLFGGRLISAVAPLWSGRAEGVSLMRGVLMAPQRRRLGVRSGPGLSVENDMRSIGETRGSEVFQRGH